MVTTIQLDEKVKAKLDELKIYSRETYNELIRRLIQNYNPKEMDKGSLVETIEIMSDPEMMEGIARGMRDFEKGKFKTLAQIKKELS